MFEKIVVGLDGSETSQRALGTACELAKKFGSEIHLVHTPQPQTVAFAMGAVAGYHAVTSMPSSDEVAKAANKIIDAGKAIAAKHGYKITQSYIESGDPADAVVGCAQNCGADLIVTGRRGLGAIGAILQGSTSLRINHLAKCATLSVV